MHTKLHRFNLLASEIDSVYHSVAVRLGLSDSAMRVLYTLCDEGGACPVGELSRRSGLSKQTIHSSLYKLEAAGVIRIEPVDKKQKRATLTEAGMQYARKTVLPVIEIEEAIFDSWTQAEQELYLELTERYLTAFREKTKEVGA